MSDTLSLSASDTLYISHCVCHARLSLIRIHSLSIPLQQALQTVRRYSIHQERLTAAEGIETAAGRTTGAVHRTARRLRHFSWMRLASGLQRAYLAARDGR